MPAERESPDLAAPDVLTRAIVHAGDHATEYVRAGCGAPVLLLAERGESALLAPLSARFRVIAPDLPCHAPAHETGVPDAGASPPPFAAWLRDFLDGLGVARIDIVAAEPYGLRALSFCVTDRTRVGRVALLFRDAPAPGVGGDAPSELLGQSGLPLLVCREGDGSTAAEVLAFLSARGA